MSDGNISGSKTTRKRFIAGAKCPKCGAIDRLVVYKEDGHDFRACVSCGFQERMLLQSVPAELETRVNTPAEDSRAETRPVKIIDPKLS